MSLDSAKAQFLSLVQSLPQDTTRNQFMQWVESTVLPEFVKTAKQVATRADRIDRAHLISGRLMLGQIASHLQTVVPLEAVLPLSLIHI